jgi:mRNA-degrading endonuclease YafQ of YafQ-DinJ toxin-antitoxin module
MRTPVYATQFKKDYKRCQKRGHPMHKLIAVMTDLENAIPLPPQMKEHSL